MNTETEDGDWRRHSEKKTTSGRKAPTMQNCLQSSSKKTLASTLAGSSYTEALCGLPNRTVPGAEEAETRQWWLEGGKETRAWHF